VTLEIISCHALRHLERHFVCVLQINEEKKSTYYH